jgi:TolA-binding protein
VFRQLAQQQEKVLGADDLDTHDSKYLLGLTLHEQQKYAEAEQLLRKVVQQQEKVLGADDVDTLESKYRLALTLYKQQKYAEAEQLFRQLVQQREKVRGAKLDTLDSKYWLELTLHEQQKYAEAEQVLRQVVQQQEKVLGADDINTCMSKRLLQKVVLAKAPSAPTNALTEVVSSRLSDFFTDGSQRQTAYTDSKI